MSEVKFDEKSIREDKIIRDFIKASYRGVFNGDPPWKEEIEQGLNCFVAGAKHQFDQLKAVIEGLQADLNDAEKREIHLESCVERLHDLIHEAQFVAPISILKDSMNIYNEAEILVRDKYGKPVRGKDAEG